MREIKFKAWHIKRSRWMNMDEIDIEFGFNGETKENSFFIDWKGKERLQDMVIISQYTGLNDKKGREIWEGDILSYGDRVVVKFSKGMFVGVYDGGTAEEIENSLFYVAKATTVLGNIYENPELIVK